MNLSEPATAPLVAVVGMGIALPHASSPAELWTALNGSRAVFSEPGSRFDLDRFWSADPDAVDRTYSRVSGYLHDFRPHPLLAAAERSSGGPGRDQAVRWLRHTLLQARDGVHIAADDRCGVYVGAWPGGSQSLIESLVVEAAYRVAGDLPEADRLRKTLLEHYRHAAPSPHGATLPDAIVRAAMDGVVERCVESLVVDTACASSLYAVDLGTKALLADECEVAHCGGVNVLDPSMAVMFAKLRGLSPTGRVRSFDASADGTLFTDGAGMVTLKLLPRALADGDTVLGVLAGFGAAADGRGKSISAPNPAGQERAVQRARAVNAFPPEHTQWIIAHGTGTPVGDGVEQEVLSALAPPQGYWCSSNKSVFGHAGWSSGVVSLIHALLALRNEQIPSQYGLSGSAPPVDPPGLRIPRKAVPFPFRSGRPRTVGVSAFGFGGTNAHLLVSDPASATGLRSNPAGNLDSTVLVAWSAHLPGSPSHPQVRDWLREAGPRPAPAFAVPYPAPDPAGIRMSSRTVPAVDPCQLMALEVASRFVETHGELWSELRDSTGVITAHMGIPRTLAGTALRCYGDDLAHTLGGPAGAPANAWVGPWLEQVRKTVPPCTEDTQAGVLPNVIASRVAARHDLHGPTMAVDAGRDGALTALKVAERYLRTGELDLALVLAVNGNSTPETAAATGLPEEGLAEGAFLLAVTGEHTARERGWPVLARLDCGQATGSRAVPVVRERSYLAADRAVDLLRAVETSQWPTELSSEHGSTAVTVLPPDSPDLTTTGTAGALQALTSRYTTTLTASPLGTSAAAGESRPSVPQGSVVLLDSAACAERIWPELRRSDAVVITTDPRSTLPGVLTISDLDAPDGRQRLREALDGSTPHLTVISDLSTATLERSLALHDVLFVAAQRLWGRWTPTSSLAVLLTGQDRGHRTHPLAALFTGFVKSLAWERPDSPVFAVVTDAPISPELLGRVTAERAARPAPPPVVHYTQGVRKTETLHPCPLSKPAPPLPIGDDSVVLVTGGAGGIPGALLAALSEQTRPTVWLLGRTQNSPVPPDVLAVDDDHLRELRTRLLRALRKREPDRPPRSAVRHVDALLRAREVQRALGRLERCFGPDRVRYTACDIQDADAVHRTVDRILRTDGRVDLVIHAAGLFRPALLERKDLDSFRLVRDVKVLGHRNLKAAFAERMPPLWCNLGSYSGTAGLPGDTDYASGNSYLEATAELSSPTTEFTVAFTLWGETGMGTDPMFQERMAHDGRLTPVSTKEGTAQFLAELSAARILDGASTYLGDRELKILRAQRPGLIHEEATHPPQVHRRPAWLGTQTPGPSDTTAHWLCLFDPDRDHYLFDHLVDGKPTLPGVLMLEIAAQAAEALVPGLLTRGFRDADFETFIRPLYRRTPSPLRIEAELLTPSDPPEATARVLVTLRSDTLGPDRQPREGARRNFRTEVLLGRAGETPAPRWSRAMDGKGTAAGDPYSAPDAPVSLRGIFRSSSHGQVQASEAQAIWTPRLAGAQHLRRMTTPALMICAALRTAALISGDDGRQPLLVPRSLARLDLHTDGANDRDLAAQYGHTLVLSMDADHVFRASTPAHRVLLEIDGVNLASLGTVSVESP
ncbi:beta-ketoacyl synthase N-terminal-like domain-containing protein [Streptomyces sp. H27-D2]|uniref:beta-ketoacyl synthase N-terminal-like domain-containing protein n=1 Tax=Streptomyces sp. H27-D2 TaxID=3046304 RepID=UPI002DB68816|nr:beta-ketoacyl synthase N-terminal-like domain-containing protein [Streptomyces sp. H27-D2]MEC4017086.1 beta-ketoacyl synthase N-terminal-like domain-containing protein [Streptomyces sp. H27-D2]